MYLKSLLKEISSYEQREFDQRTSATITLRYTVSEVSELFPLPYVNNLDSRTEYVNKIIKLMRPQLSYGVWTGLPEPTPFNGLLGLRIPREFSRGVTITFTMDEVHKERGIPKRVRWFESGTLETR